MSMRSKAAAGCLAVALSVGVAACGSSSSSSTTGSSGGKTVDVYSSLPLQGASQAQTNALQKGIALAFSQADNKAGDTTIKYTSLDDSTAQAGSWDPGQVASNARKAAQDSNAIAYVGEFNSGASAISIPILNQAGIGQISPANTYPGLTVSAPGVTEKGEPDKYYPTGKRTYARIVPNDLIQAKALLKTAQSDGCKNIAVANDKEVYGAGLARVLVKDANAAGVKLSNTGIQKDAPNFRSYASTLKSQGVDCFIFAGITANGAVQIFKDVSAALPNAKLYGPDGVCESGFTNPAKKGIPASIGAKFHCTVATLDIKATPGGAQFLKDYQAKYNESNPDPYAIYGYAAGKLVLDTIKAGGNTKDAFVTQLFKTKDLPSVLGTYSIDANGDTTLTDYGLFKVGSDGNPQFVSTIKAQ